ncbi:MAG TPA: PEP-utilizing enzyme [Acidimicrobiia bacterium]|nr:PEP-utilizing enzyme [Acidimicrobiia bacterium]
MSTGNVIGQGDVAYGKAPVTGTVKRFTTPDDVLDVIDADLDETIALVESGGTTFLGPILGRLGGLICRSGTLRSHLAIVSREFQLPCLMAVDLKEELNDGDRVTLALEAGAAQGTVVR